MTEETQFDIDAAEVESPMQEEASEQPAELDAIAGEIVSGTWINPNVPGYRAPSSGRQRREFTYTMPEGRPSFVRMVFGSFVILTEEVAERASAHADDDDSARQAAAAALHQAVQQQQAIDDRPYADLRYGAVGFVSSALDRAQGGAGLFSSLTHSAAQAAGRVIGPVWNSFLFAPFHGPAMRVEQAGESKVDEWIRRGRVEEVRSRALAEVSINSFVDETLVEVTENERIQMIVQDVIASQSTGIVAEILEEMRERLVSIDLILMGRMRRDLAPAPDFRRAYINELAEKRARYRRGELAGSLAGTYAGPVNRLAAFLVDVGILLLIVGLASSFVSSTLNLFGLTELVVGYLASGGLVSTLLLLGIASFNFLVIGAYFVLSWSLAGATVGDAILGIRVVNKQGGRVSIWRSLLRLIGMVVSALVLFIGFIWALFDQRRQGWHDKFGGTFVLYDWPAKPDESFLNAQVVAQLNRDGGR